MSSLKTEKMMKFISKKMLYILFFYLSLFVCETYYNNPTTISLSNGNLFIIHQNGIDICDENLSKISTKMTFSSENLITTDNLSKVTISKFDNGYIICSIHNSIYIFNNEGKFIFEGKNINRYTNPDYYTLAPKEIKQESYYYYLGYVDIDNNLIRLYGYEFNKEYNMTYLRYSNEWFQDNTLKNCGISCHFMNRSSKGNILTCFYITTISNKDYFRIRFFKLNGGLIDEDRTLTYKSFECSNVKYFKSDVNSDHSKAFICFLLSSGVIVFIMILMKIVLAQIIYVMKIYAKINIMD